MKIIAIGDIHGRSNWEDFVKQEFDLCVFVGDYFDSFTLDVDTQIENFEKIVEFKNTSNKKVVLLTGNHDLHYLLDTEHYSGYNHDRAIDIAEALGQAGKALTMAHQEGGLLFSHAGVTKTWAKKNKINLLDIAYSINQLPLPAFGFYNKDESRYGDNKHQGCVWVRPRALQSDLIANFVQVVGHTHMKDITAFEDKVVYIDVLDNIDKCAVFIDGKLI